MAYSYLLNHKHLFKHAKTYKERIQDQKTETPVVQQSDYLKEFMLKIVNDGLASAYEIYGKNPPVHLIPGKQPLTVYSQTSRVTLSLLVLEWQVSRRRTS